MLEPFHVPLKGALQMNFKMNKMETLEVKNTMPKLGLMTGSQAVVQALIAEGVDLMFGYPGGAIMPVYDALYDVEEELKHVSAPVQHHIMHHIQA